MALHSLGAHIHFECISIHADPVLSTKKNVEGESEDMKKINMVKIDTLNGKILKGNCYLGKTSKDNENIFGLER